MRVGFDKDWLNRAKKEKNPFNKFVSAYIVFNYHYAGYDVQGRDRDNAVNFGVAKCAEMSFDPFEFDVSEFLRCPIIDMRHPNDEANTLSVTNGDVRKLFEAIYRVRCNFFHGNKDFGNERDCKLVAQSASVLIQLMNRVINVRERNARSRADGV